VIWPDDVSCYDYNKKEERERENESRLGSLGRIKGESENAFLTSSARVTHNFCVRTSFKGCARALSGQI
jgi:hypothetical protein